MFDTKNFAEQLQILREKASLTQAELAKKIRVSIMTIRRWEWGQRVPRITEMQKLCEVLECSEDDFTNCVEVPSELPYKFDLYLGSDGRIGFNCEVYVTTRNDIEMYLSKIRRELEIAYTTQISRGVIKELKMA